MFIPTRVVAKDRKAHPSGAFRSRGDLFPERYLREREAVEPDVVGPPIRSLHLLPEQPPNGGLIRFLER